MDPIEPTGLAPQMPTLRDLLDRFLANPISDANDFGDFSFNQIGDFLDEEKSKYLNIEDGDPEKRKFNESIDLYCEIILCLESKHLGNLLERTPRDLILALDESARPSMGTDEFAAFAKELAKEEVGIHNKEMLNRMRVFMLCLSLEKNCVYAYQPNIRRFFRDRETAKRLVLDGRRIKKELLDAIAELEKNHSRWLYKGKILYSNVPTSIHYIFQVKDIDRYVPTLFECGLLTLIFGQDHVGTFNTKNIIGLVNVKEIDIIEFAFRLSRVQRLKNKIFSLTSPVSSNHLEVLEHDIIAISNLLKSFEFFHNLGKQVA